MAFKRTRERGVAVVTALLLTTLAVSIVASLFWQQQVQVRAIENQRLQLQKEWILRGALDWARLILREDARYSQVDSLDEPWAVPLSETRLDQYVENGREAGEDSDATLSGQIVDAQSMLNLNDMIANGTIDKKEVETFARLLTLVRIDPQLAQVTAETLLASSSRAQLAAQAALNANSNNSNAGSTATTSGGTTGTTGTTSTIGTTGATVVDAGSSGQIPFTQIEDLLAVPGFKPEMLEKLRNLVIFLPRTTAVNINTAPVEVIAAKLENISPSDANLIVAARKTAAFRDLADASNRLPGMPTIGSSKNIGTRSDYFLVNGRVRLGRASLQIQALIERGQGASPTTRLLWTREN
ncbi:type II secretion system minor pseudopilin GspK [Noviherbaspirillum pedocola]|uniref:Type II secretion system protein K n=1 Tax=Noviherbaspirillum pedocola TaxID=2801341 RepID=A0A934T0D8_9BURK|nr:type II secretion system minor pseudopilin GspK [Noviherbaspirillum pedocola]MBK4736442.1 type II secretion system minor pseudopilin GspK [Noviherbaspirillum pedocola]